MNWILFEKRDGDVFYITEETKDQLSSNCSFLGK